MSVVYLKTSCIEMKIIHDSFTQAPAAMLSLQWEGGEDYSS